MNVTHLFDRTVRRAFAVSSRAHDEYALPAGPEAEEIDSDRRSWLLIVIALLLAMGFAAVFFLGSTAQEPGRAPPRESAPPAAPAAAQAADEHLTLGMMLAPGTTVSKRVAGAPGAMAGDVMMALPPVEPLSELAHKLSPEWELAMASARSGEAGDKPRATLSLTSERHANRAAQEPAVAAASSQSISASLEGMKVAENRVENGITMRIFRSSSAPPASERIRLADELAACRAQGFIAGESCRYRVCNGFWGKVPECPFQDPISH